MTIQSKITAQGQISVPAEVRRALGVGPGSVLEWEQQDGKFVIQRAGRYTFEDIHKAVFPDGPPKAKYGGLKDGIREYIRERHARGRY